MYGWKSESLWSQVKREAVADPLTGTRLKAYPSTVTTWGKWRRCHPTTPVLSPETGFGRACPLASLRNRSSLEDKIGGLGVALSFHASTDLLSARTAGGTAIILLVTYWFVWKSVHPTTNRFSSSR